MIAAAQQRPSEGPLERVDALDGLRGLMAWAVAAYHFAVLTRVFEAGGVLNSALVVLGLHSVTGFFAISGFCLYHRHAQLAPTLPAIAAFYRQRFVRIAPVFYLALALNLLLGTSFVLQASGWHWVENLSFSFGLHHPNRALVTGGWSIGVEWCFYLAFPLLVLCARSLTLLAVLTLAAIGCAWSYSANAVIGSDAQRFAAYVLPQNHAFAFLAGALLAKLRARCSLRVGWSLALLAAAGVLAGWLGSRPRLVDHFQAVLGAERACYAAASCGLVGLFAFARSPGPRARRWLGALGRLSYPVYLLHPLAWSFSSAWLPAGATPGAAFAAALLTTLGLAGWVERYYERPLLARFSRKGARAPRRAALPRLVRPRSDPAWRKALRGLRAWQSAERKA